MPHLLYDEYGTPIGHLWDVSPAWAAVGTVVEMIVSDRQGLTLPDPKPPNDKSTGEE